MCGSMHTSYLNGRHLRICWVYTTFLIELSIMLFTEVEQIISWRKNEKGSGTMLLILNNLYMRNVVSTKMSFHKYLPEYIFYTR